MLRVASAAASRPSSRTVADQIDAAALACSASRGGRLLRLVGAPLGPAAARSDSAAISTPATATTSASVDPAPARRRGLAPFLGVVGGRVVAHRPPASSSRRGATSSQLLRDPVADAVPVGVAAIEPHRRPSPTGRDRAGGNSSPGSHLDQHRLFVAAAGLDEQRRSRRRRDDRARNRRRTCPSRCGSRASRGESVSSASGSASASVADAGRAGVGIGAHRVSELGQNARDRADARRSARARRACRACRRAGSAPRVWPSTSPSSSSSVTTWTEQPASRVARRDRARVGVEALVLGQQRGVDVDDPARASARRNRRESRRI